MEAWSEGWGRRKGPDFIARAQPGRSWTRLVAGGVAQRSRSVAAEEDLQYRGPIG
jgi:hypothetical protein